VTPSSGRKLYIPYGTQVDIGHSISVEEKEDLQPWEDLNFLLYTQDEHNAIECPREYRVTYRGKKQEELKHHLTDKDEYEI